MGSEGGMDLGGVVTSIGGIFLLPDIDGVLVWKGFWRVVIVNVVGKIRRMFKLGLEKMRCKLPLLVYIVYSHKSLT